MGKHDPDQTWDEEQNLWTVEEAIEVIDRIREEIEEAPESVWSRAHQFLSDVDEKLSSMGTTIEQANRVTLKQQRAITHMSDSVRRCLGN